MALVLLLVIFWFSFTNKKAGSKDQYPSSTQLNQILKRLDDLKKDIKETKDELKKTKDELKKDIKETKDELASQINMSVDILSHHYAIEKLKNCSGLIKIDPGSKQGNHYACGIFIRIGDQFFFATCLHVVYDSDSQTVRTIHQIRLVNGYFLKFKKYVIIFNDDKSPDIALIPIKRVKRFDSYAVYVDQKENFIGQSLFYISKRERNNIFGQCYVVETPFASNIIKTNCGGTHGSSGTGYINEFGHLVAIHKGQSSFLEFADIEYYFDHDNEDNDDENKSNEDNDGKNKSNEDNDGKNKSNEDNDGKNKSNKDNDDENKSNEDNDGKNKSNKDNDEVYNPYISYKNGLNQSLKMLFGNMSFETISIVKKSHLTKRSIKDLIEDPKENFTRVFYKSFDIVYKYLDFVIKFESRNPRAQAVSSKYIYDLFNNRTKNVIILKQGESHVLKTSANTNPEFSFFSTKHYAISLIIIFLSIFLRLKI